MTGRITRRGVLGIAAAIVAAGAIVAAVAAFAFAGGSPFPRLAPTAAPTTWQQVMLPNGSAVLSYPPSLHRVLSDRDAASVAQVSTAGAYLVYLNVTPRQGDETLTNWATFRVNLLREDDASSAHEISSARGVRFRGGNGSCVMDEYITRIGAHHYDEIACLAQGRTGASVIVAAALASQWAAARPLLEQAVAAYVLR